MARDERTPEDRVKKALLTELSSQGQVPLGGLIGAISLSEGAPKSKVARTLYSIVEEGKVRIREPVSRKSELEAFYSVRNLEFWLLSLIPIGTGLTILGTVISPAFDYPRIVLGSISVLLLPGYGAIGTLYLRKELSDLQILTYSVAVSLAIIPLVGVMLNYSPWGISLDSIFVSFLVIDEILLFGSSIRRIANPRWGNPPGPKKRAVKF